MTGTGIQKACGATTVLLAVTLWLGAGVAPVLAACTPSSIDASTTGVTAICSGTTIEQSAPNGYGNGENNVTVNVLSGATVTGTNFGIYLGTNAAIDNSGSIAGDNSGINADTITSLTNSGSISGIVSSGGIGINANTITSLINSGSIDGFSHGIQAGTIESLINSGSITGTINTSVLANNIHSLVNSGFIGNGVVASGFVGSLVNSGFIQFLEADTIQNVVNKGGISGISAQTLVHLDNTGSITNGVFADNIQSLNNSGSISDSSAGVLAIDSLQKLTNSGLISGGNFAIRSSAGDTQLTLLVGSVLIGRVDLGGGVNTLNVGKGLSMATTFDGAAPVIGSMSVPFVVVGDQVVTADTTSFANHATGFADLTGGIFSTVENRLDHLRGGVSSFAQPMVMAYEADASASGPFSGFGSGSAGVDRSRQVWMQAFGSHRQQEGTSTTLDSQHRLGGFVSGMDIGAGPNRTGVFFGGSVAASQVDANAGKTTSDSFFGGAYASTQMNGTFVDLAFTAGYSGFDRERRVANNQVAGGIETAKADHHGWFVSPEVRFMRPVAFGARPLEASVTLRYAGLFLDGFNESGVTAGALTVGSRDIHLGVARAALALPLTKTYSDGAQARWIWTAGIEGRTQFGGDSISGTLAGQGIAFNAGGRDSTVGLFGSYRAELASPLGHTVYAVVEGLAEQDGSYQLSGKAGFRVRY